MSEFYDPSVGSNKNVPFAPRPASLAGLTVGLYDNTKEQADVILAAIGADLRQRHGVKELLNFHGTHYSKPAPAATIEEMADKCDVVLLALGG